jgi:hypothetical protein
MYFQNVEQFKSASGYVINGLWYPRVTSILSIKAKPALYKFYADLPSFAAGEAIKTKSAEEGTLLHETVEAILGKKEVAIPDSIKPAVNSFLDFLNQREIIPHQIETRIVSKKHHYAGTMDALAEVSGKLGVLDIKTSYAIYRDYNIQAAAYVEALRENPSMPSLTRWILRIDQARPCIRGCGAKMREKGGSQKIRTEKGKPTTCDHVWGDPIGEVEFRELTGLENDIKAFLAAKTLWEWENDYWLKQID